MYLAAYLVVLAISLTLSIQHTGPVVGFEVGLSVHINLDINGIFSLANGVGWDTSGGESSADKLSNSRWAPLSDNISSLQGKLGSKDRVLDGAISVDLTERKGLVDGRALVTKSVDSSFGVDGDADGKTTGNTRCSKTGIRKIFDADAWYVFKLGSEFCHAKRSAGNLRKDMLEDSQLTT
jgi:hypothetical protein